MSSSKKKPRNLYRQRIIEAIVYFSKCLKNPNKTVIYKSLAMLDFRHFAATGLPVTDLQYEAYFKGPVPAKLHKEITIKKEVILPADFSEALTCTKTEFYKADGTIGVEFTFRAKRKPNLKVFSPRQVNILEEVKDIHLTATATQASDASHEPGTPWYETVKKHGREGDIIDMVETIELVKPLTKHVAAEKLRERAALDYNYGA